MMQMSGPKAFIDTNIILYLFSADTEKADQAEKIVMAGGRINVQVLNEMVSVARRKLGMSWMEINEIVESIQRLCPVEPLTVETHDLGRWVAERYGFSVYDAMIVAAAIVCGCGILYSEDMQDGFIIDQRLRICNPFVHSSWKRSTT